jgi:excisionase family DNA binding protein
MLTVKQVADELCVSATCVYQLIALGKLASHRIGVGRGAIRISVEDLAAFVEQSRRGEQPMQSVSRRSAGVRARFKHLEMDR